MREATVLRKTAETDVQVTIDLDGRGTGEIQSGVGFFNHMLELMMRHSRIDLHVVCQGDTWVDDHHSVEDIGIALGQAVREALGDKRGICRCGFCILPMDEALIQCAIDVSGRGGFFPQIAFPTEKIGTFDTQLVTEFFTAFAANAGIALHLRKLAGENSHHIAEGAFKAVGRSLRQAVGLDRAFAEEIPSTKGIL